MTVVSKCEGKLIGNRYIDPPWNNQKTPHLCWPINEVKHQIKISYICQGTSPLCGRMIFQFNFQESEVLYLPTTRTWDLTEIHTSLRCRLVSSMCKLAAVLAAFQAMFGVLSWTPKATLGRSYLDGFFLYTRFYLFKFILQVLDLILHLYTFSKHKNVSLGKLDKFPNIIDVSWCLNSKTS